MDADLRNRDWHALYEDKDDELSTRWPMRRHLHSRDFNRFFSRGDGSSPERAVRINMLLLPEILARQHMGVRLEHFWLVTNTSFVRVSAQKLVEANGIFDCLQIELPNGEKREVYFEISTFFNREPSPPGTIGLLQRSQGWPELKFPALALLISLTAVLVSFCRAMPPAKPEHSLAPLIKAGANADALIQAVEGSMQPSNSVRRAPDPRP